MSAGDRLIRLTTEEHRQLIHRLRNEAEAWLEARGIDQYQPRASPRAAKAHAMIDETFDRGEFVGLEHGTDVVAVMALTEPDPDFWSPRERAEPQGYISRFLVATHGQGHGTDLLRLVAEAERGRGAETLRLDCWKTNTGLHEYYRRLGFEHVRTVDAPGRSSGALFEYDLRQPGMLTPAQSGQVPLLLPDAEGSYSPGHP